MIQSALPDSASGVELINVLTINFFDGPIFGMKFDETATIETITGYLSDITGTLFSTGSILYDLLYATGIQRFFLTLTQSLTPT